jgi:enamine deaminase RidA (YjgF/YER057c/UK114 family)
MADIQRYGSGGPWEDVYGYARVVTAGGFAYVSGCTATVDGVVVGADAATQARTAIGIALDALAGAGVPADNVVRTRMYVVHRPRRRVALAARRKWTEDADAVGRVHGEFFGSIRPAASLVLVAGLLHPDHLFEIEVVALAR